MMKRIYIYLFGAVLLAFVSSCSSTKSMKKSVSIGNLSETEYMTEVLNRAPAWDALSAKMEDNGYFILPGGSLVSAHLQLARTIVRRAERRLWTLNRKDPVSPGIMQFVNRLSDLFFTMARYEMFRQGNAEERWQSFLYKRKK